MSSMAVDIIQLETGWEKMKEGIDKFLDNRDAKAIHHVGLK